jgi:ABC-type lipoprotein release transport system permease subunit
VGRELAAMPEVEHISGGIVWAARIEEFPLFIIFAYDPREYAIQQFHLVEGRSLEREREVLLGKGAAERLNKRIGDEIEIMDTSFRVVGIYGTGVALEDSAAVISLDEAQHLFGKPDQVMFYTIKLKRPWEADRVLREIEERIPEIAVFKSAEFAEKLPDMQTTRAMVAAISFLVVLVGGVGMTNTMVMSVFERKREIGVLRALGWRRRRILEMILREALLLSFLAGIAGIAMGVGLGRGLALIPVVSGWLQPDFNLSAFLQAMVIALALGSLGGLYPAWRASGTDPVEALRYE